MPSVSQGSRFLLVGTVQVGGDSPLPGPGRSLFWVPLHVHSTLTAPKPLESDFETALCTSKHSCISFLGEAVVPFWVQQS